MTSSASILKYSINSLIQIPELFMKVKGLIAYIFLSPTFPVVSKPLNLGFCFDRPNFLFMESIILKPTLCLLFSLSGVGLPSPTNKSMRIF